MRRIGQTGEAIEGARRGDALEGAPAYLRALRERIDRPWRIFATGLSFAVFGIGAMVAALTLFPLARLLPGEARTRDLRVQRLVHWSYRFFVGLMVFLGLNRFRYEGFERLTTPGPHLIVANHPSLIDTVTLLRELPQADCVVGESWARKPFIGRAARLAGYVMNTSGAAAVDACVARLREGRTLVVFPEGTRSPNGGLHPFQRGAAHIALRSGCDLELVTLHVDPPTLKKGQPWWDVPERPVEYLARVEEPVRVGDHAKEGVGDALAARRITAELRARVIEGLNRGSSC